MGYFLSVLLLLVCLAGGAYYGFSYLRAKASKQKVADVIVSDIAPKK